MKSAWLARPRPFTSISPKAERQVGVLRFVDRIERTLQIDLDYPVELLGNAGTTQIFRQPVTPFLVMALDFDQIAERSDCLLNSIAPSLRS